MAKPITRKQSTRLKLPPQSIEAEESVLGSLLIDKDAINKVVDILTPEDFYKPTSEKIYSAIIDLNKKNQPIDIVSLTNRLKEKNEFRDVGGSAYLVELANGVPSATNIESYAKIVKEKKILRDLIRASADISDQAFSSEEDVETILDKVEQEILSISQKSLPRNFIAVKDELKQFWERLEGLQGKGMRGIPTGFADLDKKLSGLQKSNLIVLGARPSLGKTSFVLDVARQAAIASGLPIGLFSLEMSREQIIDRFVSAAANVPLWKIRGGAKIEAESDDWARIQQALDELSKVKIFIDDTPSPTVNQIRSMARQMQMKHGLGLLIVDYLQLVQSKIHSDNTVSQFTEISRGLKSLARELDIPVIAVSQLNRLVDQREIKIPRLSDLRETGAIEQDADIVLFIYRKDRDRADVSTEEQNITEIIIAKHRNGPIGKIKLLFNPEFASFRNLDTTHQNDPFA